MAAEVAFAAGAAEVDRLDTELAPLLQRLRRDGKLEVTLKHELGGGDVARAAGRASPPIDEAELLAQRLRERKADLLEARRMLAGQSRVAVSTAPGSEAARRSIDELRAVDRDIAATEDALDSLYDLLRPGADRQAGRRTRAASLELADARLEVVKDAIESSDVPNVRSRVRVLGARFTEVGAGDTSGGRVVCSVLEKK